MMTLTKEELRKITEFRKKINQVQLLRLTGQLVKTTDLKTAKRELAVFLTKTNAKKKQGAKK